MCVDFVCLFFERLPSPKHLLVFSVIILRDSWTFIEIHKHWLGFSVLSPIHLSRILHKFVGIVGILSGREKEEMLNLSEIPASQNSVYGNAFAEQSRSTLRGSWARFCPQDRAGLILWKQSEAGVQPKFSQRFFPGRRIKQKTRFNFRPSNH